ncbi:major facilitator superfamily transporter [Apiospora arundinis]
MRPNDARDPHWLGYRVAEVLKAQSDKILTNFNHGAGGWEAWAQFELMYNLTHILQPNVSDTSHIRQNDADCEFEREKQYEGSNKRSDLTINVTYDDILQEFHLVELKCRSSKEAGANFAERVREDINKVNKANFHEWRDFLCNISGAWVIAVSVSSELDELMHAAARSEGVKWHPIDVTEDGAIKTFASPTHGNARWDNTDFL